MCSFEMKKLGRRCVVNAMFFILFQQVTDLKKLLKERGLAITGNKSELVSRLQAHESNADVEPETENGAGKFSHGSLYISMIMCTF